MNIEQYRCSLRAIEALMVDDPELDTPMGRAIDPLVHLVEEYEKIHYPFKTPTPGQLAEFRRLERGL